MSVQFSATCLIAEKTCLPEATQTGYNQFKQAINTQYPAEPNDGLSVTQSRASDVTGTLLIQPAIVSNAAWLKTKPTQVKAPYTLTIGNGQSASAVQYAVTDDHFTNTAQRTQLQRTVLAKLADLQTQADVFHFSPTGAATGAWAIPRVTRQH